jgi:hypothetical protein
MDHMIYLSKYMKHIMHEQVIIRGTGGRLACAPWWWQAAADVVVLMRGY